MRPCFCTFEVARLSFGWIDSSSPTASTRFSTKHKVLPQPSPKCLPQGRLTGLQIKANKANATAVTCVSHPSWIDMCSKAALRYPNTSNTFSPSNPRPSIPRYPTPAQRPSRSFRCFISLMGNNMKYNLPPCRIRSRSQQYFEGWRAGAIMSCFTALVVLIINIIVTSWAASNYPSVHGVGTLFSGKCDKAKSINTWLQIVVNVLSTTLLAASNYCMQCVSSPTRQEVDAAHAHRKILDIGIPSIRNLKYIGGERRVLWIAVAISALPLHFMFVRSPITAFYAFVTLSNTILGSCAQIGHIITLLPTTLTCKTAITPYCSSQLRPTRTPWSQ